MRLFLIGLLLLASAASAQEAATPYVAATASDGTPLPQFQPQWGAALRGGAALPLGKLTGDNAIGGMTGLDAFYHGTQNTTVDLLGLYVAMPYTAAGGGGPTPLTTLGIAVKLDYEVYRADQASAWVGLGVGYIDAQSVQHNVHYPIIDSVVTYDLSTQSSTDLALLACIGADYEFYPHWTVNLELLILSVDSLQGTSNTFQAALPDVFVKYLF